MRKAPIVNLCILHVCTPRCSYTCTYVHIHMNTHAHSFYLWNEQQHQKALMQRVDSRLWWCVHVVLVRVHWWCHLQQKPLCRKMFIVWDTAGRHTRKEWILSHTFQSVFLGTLKVQTKKTKQNKKMNSRRGCKDSSVAKSIACSCRRLHIIVFSGSCDGQISYPGKESIPNNTDMKLLSDRKLSTSFLRSPWNPLSPTSPYSRSHRILCRGGAARPHLPLRVSKFWKWVFRATVKLTLQKPPRP